MNKQKICADCGKEVDVEVLNPLPNPNREVCEDCFNKELREVMDSIRYRKVAVNIIYEEDTLKEKLENTKAYLNLPFYLNQLNEKNIEIRSLNTIINRLNDSLNNVNEQFEILSNHRRTDQLIHETLTDALMRSRIEVKKWKENIATYYDNICTDLSEFFRVTIIKHKEKGLTIEGNFWDELEVDLLGVINNVQNKMEEKNHE